MSQSHHPLVALAYQTVETYVRTGQRLQATAAQLQDPLFAARAGVFVSIHEKNGDLRGCVGTFMPTHDNLADEVIDNAIAAAARDPRFYPIQPAELDNLEISVDVLSEPEPISSEQELDPQVYGVIVTDYGGHRRGLLLPMLEQVKTAAQQVAIAKQKAYIGPNEPVKLLRFRVQRYH